MPFTPEQQKAYYEANKLKLNQQRAERRKLKRLRQSNTQQVETLQLNNQVETVLPKDKVETNQVETPQLENIGSGQVETQKNNFQVETVDKADQKELSQPKVINLWTNYYNYKKPHCQTCIEQGIKDNEYKFCSTEKKPLPIYDEWNRKVIHTFNDIYACNVYHWTIYQGASNKIETTNISNIDNLKQIRTSPLSQFSYPSLLGKS